MGSKKPKKTILLDADVVSHFITGGAMYLLPNIFKYETVILDKVYNELQNFRRKQKEVDNLVSQKLIRIIDFPESNNGIKLEYFRLLQELIGDGEAACMAVARYSKNIIGSSNLRDIKIYCEEHEIVYLTTIDFLCQALKTNKMDLEACNTFIRKVLGAGSRLPVSNMDRYQCRDTGL